MQVTVDGWRGPGWRAYGAHPRHIKAIRDWIAHAVASHSCPVDPGIAALAVSELFTNAILHGPSGGRVLVGYCLWGGGVRIVVCDGGGTTIPQLRDPADGEEGGRGLHVVEALSAQWDNFRADGAQIVWCDLGQPLAGPHSDALAWLAAQRMGPVRYVEASHRWGQREAARFFFETNLDEQQDRIGTPAGRVWRETTAAIPAGAVSVHQRLTLHASGPNHSDMPRLGLAIHLRTERARLIATPEPPFHRPDLSDPYACPVLTERPRRGRTTEMTGMDHPTEESLTGGFITSSVTRSGSNVRRSAGPWSPAVHAWLAHLARAGINVAPRPVRLDLDAGTEELTYIDGTVLSGGASPPYLWRDGTLTALARLIRQFHDAAATFTPPAGAAWQQTAAHPAGGDVICHNDLAPWNTAFAGERPVGFIDWDLAAPGPRWWDVSYALWHFVPLYGDPGSDPFDLAEFEPRARRTRLFCNAYDLEDRHGLVDKILERQRAVHTAIKHGAETGDPAYRRLWELGAGAGIERQIDYVRAHRSALEDALT